jgi:hypothetical protein
MDVTLASVISPSKTPARIVSVAPNVSSVLPNHVTIYGIPASILPQALARISCGSAPMTHRRGTGNFTVVELPSAAAVSLVLTVHGSVIRAPNAPGDGSGDGAYIIGIRRSLRHDVSPTYLAEALHRLQSGGAGAGAGASSADDEDIGHPTPRRVLDFTSPAPARTANSMVTLPAGTPARPRSSNAPTAGMATGAGAGASAGVFDITHRRRVRTVAMVEDECDMPRKRRSICTSLLSW